MSQHLAFATPRTPRVSAEFLWRQMEAQYEWLRLESSGGGSTRAALTCEYIKGLPVAVPPPDEQDDIVVHISRGERDLRALLEEVDRGIDRLKEYRAALISAAVTGKIDVRET